MNRKERLEIIARATGFKESNDWDDLIEKKCPNGNVFQCGYTDDPKDPFFCEILDSELAPIRAMGGYLTQRLRSDNPKINQQVVFVDAFVEKYYDKWCALPSEEKETPAIKELNDDERLEAIAKLIDFTYMHSGGGIMVIEKECTNKNIIVCGYGGEHIGCDLNYEDGDFTGHFKESDIEDPTLEQEAIFVLKFALDACQWDV